LTPSDLLLVLNELRRFEQHVTMGSALVNKAVPASAQHADLAPAPTATLSAFEVKADDGDAALQTAPVESETTLPLESEPSEIEESPDLANVSNWGEPYEIADSDPSLETTLSEIAEDVSVEWNF